MPGDLDYSLSPAVRRIASAFRWVGWVSFWCQGVLGIISSLVLIFAAATRSVRTEGAGNPGTGTGLVLAVVGLVAVFVGAFWAFRYTRLARRLRSRDGAKRPKPRDAVQALKFGLFTGLGGMFVSLLGAEAIVGSLLAKALSQPQGAAVFGAGANVTQFVQPLDIFVVQANTNILLAHFSGIVCTLWLFRTVNRP
ncbi:DUF3611 family protein [Leptolyngbya sp. PCC 6406]|uniref:DUF3611 family protein n=1 Tax=Leptolyngbya sp. PCC 6406 TaxID=1173264 RepID=UPI0002ACD778|nr:DUF3611 family protein [Leptolyngbya sp. PCC 6406]